MKPVQVSARPVMPLIGARLRATRLRQALTIDQVASATGLTKGFISRVERDETSPSVSTLLNICDVLSLPVGTLFEAADADLIRSADAPQIRLSGAGANERLLTPRGQGRLQVVRSLIEPDGTGGTELYTLNCELEVCHVLRGKIDVVFSEETHRLTAGDTMTFAGREPHTWINPDSKRTAEVMWVISPAPWNTST